MNISLSQPDITDVERKAVQEVLQTSSLSLGPKMEEFGEKMALAGGRAYGVAVNSGTAALHLIIRGLGIQEGDEVITTSFSFIASSNCMLYERAKPVFCDIDERTLTIDPSKIEEKITEKTKAILGVDVFGHPADWDAILSIAEKHHLKVIEDSAEALGSEYNGKKCGSFGDAAIFSFYPNKQMTTGEGGVALTDDKELAEFFKSMINQGRRPSGGKWLEHVRLGFNYRLPEMACALGLAQLSRIQEILEKRERVANLYTQLLKDIPEVQVPYVAPWAKMSWFVYVVRLSKEYTLDKRDQVIERMREKGIQCGSYFFPIHLQPPYQEMFGYKRGELPITEHVSDRTIALPFYNNLKEEETAFVTEELKNSLAQV